MEIDKDSTTSRDMWRPFKELQGMVEAAVARPQDDMLKRLEDVLRNHKQNFLTLLQNPPKNSQHRENLRKGLVSGFEVGSRYQTLPKELVDETIIISDMFNINEYMALDLLCTAEIQMSYHPGLTRGLVAVLLYYDGRKAVVSALRTLVQSRRGISWSLEASDHVVSYITNYTQELLDNGIIGKILNLITSLDLSKEVELLQQNRALGGPRHHRQVSDLFQSIRQILADIVYFWAAQSGLSKEFTLQLINTLKVTKMDTGPTGGIDGVTLALQMALLYALDLSILQKREDGEEVIQKLPLLTESDFVSGLMRELSPGGPGWECRGLEAIAHLAFGLALATLRMAPQSLHPTNLQDEDDLLVDSAIELKVFDFLHHTFLNNESIFTEEFYLRRIHSLIADFIVFMPMKVKRLKSQADETARVMQIYAQEGIDPPLTLPHHYEKLLLSISTLYSKDPLRLSLMVDYWCPADELPHKSYPYRSPPTQVSLFKFVRTSGDALPTPLFIPYVKMLRSLSASPRVAKYAFNMLKQTGPGNMPNVSWDHFFTSLNRYYTNLRQELPPTTDTVYHHHHHSFQRGITPQEVACLQAVLALIKTVAENDELSRIALCENVSWSALSVLLGLVTCSISIPLKADLLSTLGALARSPETAATLWYNLEASQILSTVPSTSSYQPRGIQTELEELESRNEEFPLTRAMLGLLDVLTDGPVPRLLGVGVRVPGFDPYLRFVLNSVFSKFHTRSYKDPEEKWVVGKGCLQLFVKFLTQYEPRLEDFGSGRIELQGGGCTKTQPPPGYHIMVSLNSTSELLRLVLYLIDEGCTWLDTYTSFAGKAALEAVMLSCLSLIDKALAMQQRFFTLLSASGSSLLLVGLNKLLLGINPRSGQPDHLLNVAKYVTYNSWLPHHSLTAVNILLSATSYPTTHTQLLGALTCSAAVTTSVRHGFVECLEAESDDLGADGDQLSVQDRTKEAVLKLLQQCLNQPPPNLTHFLCGFDIAKDVTKTVFQQAGIMGFPLTCIHSLITILDGSLTHKSRPPVVHSKPHLIEAAYAMLYALCANTKTSEPVLRFMHSCGDFLHRHICSMPFHGPNGASSLNQMAWLLKMTAMEMKVSASKRQNGQLVDVILLLTQESMAATDEDHPSRRDHLAHSNLSQFLSTPSATTFAVKTQYPLLLRLLGSLDMCVEKVETKSWEFFEPTQIRQVMASCEVVQPSGLKLVDVKALHRTLMDELATFQGTSTTGQRKVILNEIQEVLVHSLKSNAVLTRGHSAVRFMDAWRQATEVLFAVTPPEVMSYDLRQELLLSTVHLLLKKVLSEQVLPEIANMASSTVLLLMVNLRHCYVKRQKDTKYATATTSTHGNTGNVQSHMAVLKVILSSLLEWILGSGVTSQMLRANLYGALLNFLHIACLGGSEKYQENIISEKYSGNSSEYISQLDSSRVRMGSSDLSSQRQASLEVITEFGEGLVDILCRDSTGGHDVCKMLALSCLDVLVALDSASSWVTFLSGRGYLKHLIDSLLDADGKLAGILDPVPNNLRPLYVYESKMAMLCRVASSRTGAELLLEQNGIACLSSMTVFDRHPDIKPSELGMEVDFVPSVGHRYMQILFPALDLCDAVLTSLGTENESCSSQIMYFLMSHNEMIAQVLRSGNPFLQVGYLKELALLTGVVARSANQDICNVSMVAQDASVVEGVVHLQRIQKQMLSLFSQFVVSESLLREVGGAAAPRGANAADGAHRTDRRSSEAVLRFFQVACHLALYARNIVASRGVDHRASSVVFKVGLSDMAVTERRARDQFNYGETSSPNLGVVVQQLLQCVSHHHRETAALEILVRKHSSVSTMNSLELNEFLPEGAVEQTSISECRTKALECLQELLKRKRQELKCCSFLIENCLYLVWCHLDYYMLRAIPKSNFANSLDRSKGHGFLASLSETSWQVTTDEISQMKQGLVTIFNDTFSKQLVDTKQDASPSDKGFVEALLRRIKRLIQFVPVK